MEGRIDRKSFEGGISFHPGTFYLSGVMWKILFWVQKLFFSVRCASFFKSSERKLELKKTEEEHKWNNSISGKTVTGDQAWSYSTVHTWVSLCDSRSPQWVNKKKTIPWKKIGLFSAWIWVGKKKEQSLLRIPSLWSKNHPGVGLEFKPALWLK